MSSGPQRNRAGGRPVGVVLAGGNSTRMGGQEKTFLELGGKTLLARVVDRLAPQVAAAVINANGDPARFGSFGLPVIGDDDDGRLGPLAGILAGMRWARRHGHSQIVSVAGDTPFFPDTLVRNLAQAAELQSASIVLAASRDDSGKLHLHPTFGLWDTGLMEDLEGALRGGVRKILDWTDTHWTVPAEFPGVPVDPFFNINRPDDLEAAALMLEAAAG